jgi:drug/metabolite transporter (DMT)-like permease
LRAAVSLNGHARGIAMLIAAMACFAASDALAKKLATRLPAIEIAWFRYVGLLITVLPLLWSHRPPRSVHTGVQVVRAIGMVASSVLFIMALDALPVAEATALVFASPLFVTLLSRLLLHERVDGWRWIAVAGGFLGVLIVMRPGSAAFHPAALLPVASSLAWAVALVCTRKASGRDNALTTITYSATIGVGLLTLVVLPSFVVPTAAEAALAALMAVAWSSAQWLTVGAYQRSDASLIAPFAYSQLLFAALLGYAMFGDVPDMVSLTGMGIIVACGALAASIAGRKR